MPIKIIPSRRSVKYPEGDGQISAEQLILRFRELHRLSVSTHKPFAELYQDYLDTGLELLGLKIGVVSRIEADTYHIIAVSGAITGITAGDQFRLNDTYCSWVVEAGQVVAIEAIGADPQRCLHPVYLYSQLECYLAAPILVDQKIYGTLCFTDTVFRSAPFSPDDRELVELMALGIGQLIERELLEQQRQLANRRMSERVELFENAFEYASKGMALVSVDGRWLRFNQALLDILGYSETELMATDFQAITHPDDLGNDRHLVNEMLAGKRKNYRMEKRYYHREGQVIWVLLSVALVRDGNGKPRYFVSQMNDISEQKRVMEELFQKRNELEIANRKLQELAIRDALTGVNNRRAFDERLQHELTQALRTEMPLSLLIIDIDHFKEYNDSYGHLAGDQALKVVAKVLTSTIRAGDMVARYGGEEFMVILPCTDLEGAILLAQRIRSAIESILSLQRTLTASIGAACFNSTKAQHKLIKPDQLIACADKALYCAKSAGRNQVQVGAF